MQPKAEYNKYKQPLQHKLYQIYYCDNDKRKALFGSMQLVKCAVESRCIEHNKTGPQDQRAGLARQLAG